MTVASVLLVSSVLGAMGAVGSILLKFFPRPENVPPVPFSADARAILEGAAREVRERGEVAIAPEHILMALIEEPTFALRPALQQSGLDIAELRRLMQAKLSTSAPKPEAQTPTYTAQAYKVLVGALRDAFASKCDEAGPIHLLGVLLRDDKSRVSHALRKSGVTLDGVRAAITTRDMRPPAIG